MEIQSGKSKLEEHIRQKDLNVKELISDGVLYPHESEFNIIRCAFWEIQGDLS